MNNLLFNLYKYPNNQLRKIVIKLIYRFEGGQFYSTTLRKIFSEYYKVDIGLYTHGACFIPGRIDKHTTIGRYSSLATTTQVMNRNHPMNFKSMHGFFFNPILGFCQEDKIEYIPLDIGNDVWLGHNSIIMPNVKNIGDGAVVAAGAVVNKDIPPYAVVVGNPARIVRFRFSKEKIEELLASKWWDKSIEELKNKVEEYTRPFETLSVIDNEI